MKLCSTNSNCTNTSINSLNQYSICYFGEMAYNSTIDINVEISTEADISTNKIIKVQPYCHPKEVYNDITGICISCYSGPIYMYTNTCAGWVVGRL